MVHNEAQALEFEMTFGEAAPGQEIWLPYHAAVKRFQRVVEELAEPGLAPDEESRSFYGDLHDHLSTYPRVQASIYKHFEQRPPANVKSIANRALRAVQAIEISADPFYPLGKTARGSWRPSLERAESDEYYPTFDSNMQLYVGSNIADRGKVIPPIAAVHGKNGPVDVLEIGCSQNRILTKLSKHGDSRFRYGITRVVEDIPQDPHEPVTEDYLKSNYFSYLVQQKSFQLGRSMGIDLHDADDTEAQTWADSCSLYPSECTARNRRIYEELRALQPDNVQFFSGNFGAPFDHERFAASLDGNTAFDIVYLPTVLYQLPPDEQQAIMANAHKYVETDGLIVVQDFVEIDDEDNIEVQDYWNWHYAIWVKDMSKGDEARFEKYMVADGGRVRKVALMPALGRLPLAKHYGLSP